LKENEKEGRAGLFFKAAFDGVAFRFKKLK
jgi:hypothetical protein